jgi:hypothetical protein
MRALSYTPQGRRAFMSNRRDWRLINKDHIASKSGTGSRNWSVNMGLCRQVEALIGCLIPRSVGVVVAAASVLGA